MRQIRRQEDDDADFRDFARLEAERTNLQPNAAAEDFLAEAGNHGGEQQNDAQHHERIFVLRETVDVAHDRQSDHHARDAHEQPDDLAYRQIGCEARDECDADAGKAECDGQDGRIGVFRKEAGGDVRHHKRGKQAEGCGERFKRKRRALLNEHHGE